MPVSCECCVLSGSFRCVGLITRPEESYQVRCLSMILKPRKSGGPDALWAVAPWKKCPPEGVQVCVCQIILGQLE
jgi:hypothetical protein